MVPFLAKLGFIAVSSISIWNERKSMTLKMLKTLRLIAQPLLMVETPYFQNDIVYALIRGSRWKNSKIPIILRPRPKHLIGYNCLCSRDIGSKFSQK